MKYLCNMNQTRKLPNKSLDSLSEKEKDELFKEVLYVAVIRRRKSEERERSAWVKKLKALTKGKKIVVTNLPS